MLERKLNERVDTFYNDPPYNTGDDFIYKDNYRKSSWIAKLEALAQLIFAMLKPKGACFTSIDDNQYRELISINSRVFGQESEGTIIRVNPSTKSWAEFLSVTHDYCLVSIKPAGNSIPRKQWRIKKPYVEEFKARTSALLKSRLTDEEKRSNLRELVKTPMFKAFDHYVEYDKRGVYAAGNPNRTLQSEGAKVFPDVKLVHPIKKKFCAISENWRFDQKKSDEIASRDPSGFHFGPDENTVPRIKTYIDEYEDMTPQSVMFDDTQVDTKTILPGMGLSFDFPKPVSFVRRLVEMSTEEGAFVADCFAGSGTTAHAVIDLNRHDGKARRFLLIDFGEYFDTTLEPRLQKLIFSPVWKDGHPARLASKIEIDRSPHMVKVLYLESYEDALHNLTTEETLTRSEPRANAYAKHLGPETYRLRYLARLPLEESASLLQLDKLDHPFDYTLEILTEDGPKSQTVDLVETFNYLLGLDVQRMETWENPKDKRRLYRVVKGKDRAGKRILIVWRDVADLDPRVEREFLEVRIKKEDPFDRMLINGDSAAPGFESLDALFKQLMMGD